MPSEIELLQLLQEKHHLSVVALNKPSKEGMIPVLFHVGKKTYDLYVYDEYQDFDAKNQLLCIYLVLSAIEDYLGSQDYLVWCKNQTITPDDTWLQYYRDLASKCREMELVLGKIDSYIPHLEYELRSGSYYELLKNNT